MKKQISSAFTVFVLAAAGATVAGGEPAQAQVQSKASSYSPRAGGCVTQHEFGRAKKGMRMRKVHHIFGTSGHRESIAHGGGTTIEIRSYKACTQYGAVAVSYTNGRLSAKSGVF